MILYTACQSQYTAFVVIVIDIWVSAQSYKFLWSDLVFMGEGATYLQKQHDHR